MAAGLTPSALVTPTVN
nr:ORF3 [Drosophila melanogaster]